MKTLPKLLIVTVLLQIVTTLLISYIAAGNKTDSFNGMQMLGPLLAMPTLLIVFTIHQIVDITFTKIVMYAFLAAAILFDVLLVYSTLVGVNQ